MVREFVRNRLLLAVTCAAVAFAIVPPTAATAATTIDGPVGLGTADSFAVLAYATITNAGSSAVVGDVGLHPGTAVTGWPDVSHTGTVYKADAVALQAKTDLDTAYNTAARLTPTATGYAELGGGTSLGPGVYSGDALSVTGELTLAGTAESVWVFQAASTLTVASNAQITVTGGASVCNVFWQVGSAATLGVDARFVGTVMAHTAISALTRAEIEGRLFARTAAVTLDTNIINAPSGCDADGGTATSSPTITSSAPPSGQAGTDYSHTVTASGTSAPTFAVTSGVLPQGLSLDLSTGLLAGHPTTAGTYTFTITATSDVAPADSETYSLIISEAAPATEVTEDIVTPARQITGDAEASDAATSADELARTGSPPSGAPALGVLLLASGVAAWVFSRRRRHAGSVS